MYLHKLHAYLFAMSIAVVFPVAGWAQISSSTGAIQGVVTDPQNATIGSANIRLTNADTGASVSALSQADGTFVLSFLAPGNYKIQIQAPGFESSVYDATVEITKVTSISAKLRLGQVSTVTEVTGTLETVDTHTATTGRRYHRHTDSRNAAADAEFPGSDRAAGRYGGPHAKRRYRGPRIAHPRRVRLARNG